ncbi:ParB/RepB/Spo0J family partition protein [Moraxella marmotae]|uniref:ParB/RepB/Spo0J family partition protein n=1 Tax=Moraxella marmotae TaxID=3344520 RepID=UPI0035F4F272
MSKHNMQALLQANIAQNLETHAIAKKGFDGFDVYQNTHLETLAIADIQPNPMQPRVEFDEESLQELADSIQQNGLLQPITVRRTNNGYHIVAGERRLRAHKLLGKTRIDCLVVYLTDEQNALLALAENLSRQDLSDFETAQAVNKIKSTFDNKSDLAKALGISRSKLYKLFAFDNLPDNFLTYLKSNPSLISADIAEQIKSLQKSLKLSDGVLGELLLKAANQIESGKIKQSHLCQFISDAIDTNQPSELSDNKQSTDKPPAPIRAPASSNVRKMYIRDGKSIGKVKADGKKLTIELMAQSLTSEQESKIMQFLDELLDG